MKSNELERIIINKIKSQGPIPFDEFMNMSLYYPELGYYTREDLKIGKEGDFFTASHLGKVFGIILTKALEILWRKMEHTDEFSIAEIGPGMGYLAEDILSEIVDNKIFDSLNFKYILVEMNSELVRLQKERLKKYSEKTIWLNSVEQLKSFTGVLLCNEIFDALPVRLFEIRKNSPFEVYVTVDGDGNFTETLLPAREDTISYLEEFAPWVFKIEGYRSEVNLEIKRFIEKLAFSINKGYVIIFDYGFDSKDYYSSLRTRGNLLCYYRHNVHENPYINIGKQDITSHINFSALEKWAKTFGFNLEEYTSQSNFLISLCSESLLERLNTEGLIQKFKRLVLPQGMGETHRVMILSKFQPL